jgi:REP element-mobilizing transposase RayT
MSEPNEIYYVVLRGAGRQPIFQSDGDRDHFTQVVAQAVQACRVTVYAYCWLEAEARLAVKMSDISISRFAKRVAREHAQRLNREVSLTDSHFEQKCRGVKVDGQTALTDLVRHIHLAPLKAGLAADPAVYPWSSHRVYLGIAKAQWLSTKPLLRQFGQSAGDGVLEYRKFMAQAAGNLSQRDILEIEGVPRGEFR